MKHILILKAFDELKFNLGKKTLVDLLKGNENQTISRNNLEELNSYGILYEKTEEEILEIIEQLLEENLLQIQEIRGGFKVLIRTIFGTKEIIEKKFKMKKNEKIEHNFLSNIKTKITEEDKKNFKTFDFFLKKFNDEQKQAIISKEKNILCIAGAGSGKTTVLVKKIEFLKKFKNINEKKILAITFTRKAKEEMKKRLEELEIKNIYVETFNSFCEKILKKFETKIYSRHTRVISFKEKIQILNFAIKKTNTNFELLKDDYFNKKQLKEKTKDELFFIFINDIFTILDFYKNTNIINKNESVNHFYEKEKNYHRKQISKTIYNILKIVEKELQNKNLRDFSDQILDTLHFFEKNKELIPKFEFLLIDEFQDLNLPQFKLVKLLNPENIFAVGDPRQAIYGWRGSDIKFILNFPKEFKNTQIIPLKKNYRSTEKIVALFNLCIKKLKLNDLESTNKNENNYENNISNNSIFLQEFNSEQLERIFVLEAIKNSKNKRKEIFVLARTNKILNKYVELFRNNGIDYIIKSEEEYNTKQEAKENQVTLATVHSIKGMEAKEVYIVNSNNLSFPNKATDNFVLSLIKKENYYDKEEEELRLFYVALSRAKEKLIITYTGKPTKFITDEMLSLFEIKKKKNLFDFYNKNNQPKLNSTNNTILINMLKDWRREKAEEQNVPLYLIITNKTIDDLIQKRPQTKAELFNINGLGPTKIIKYSEELLKLING